MQTFFLEFLQKFIHRVMQIIFVGFPQKFLWRFLQKILQALFFKFFLIFQQCSMDAFENPLRIPFKKYSIDCQFKLFKHLFKNSSIIFLEISSESISGCLQKAFHRDLRSNAFMDSFRKSFRRFFRKNLSKNQKIRKPSETSPSIPLKSLPNPIEISSTSTFLFQGILPQIS